MNDVPQQKRPWLSWLLSGVVLSTLGGAAAFLVIPVQCTRGQQPDRTNARALEAAAVAYLSEHPSCPSISDLVRDAFIRATQPVSDRWGNRFEVVCANGEPCVESAGVTACVAPTMT